MNIFFILKSTSPSQVALIVFLSHIGSFVPADAATVGVTDRLRLLFPNLHCPSLVTLVYFILLEKI